MNVANKDGYTEFDFLNDQSSHHTPNTHLKSTSNGNQDKSRTVGESPYSSPMQRKLESGSMPQFLDTKI